MLSLVNQQIKTRFKSMHNQYFKIKTQTKEHVHSFIDITKSRNPKILHWKKKCATLCPLHYLVQIYI